MLPGWKSEKTPNGYLMISPKMAMDRRRRKTKTDPEEGFASRISYKDRPHDPGGGGGHIGRPNPQNVMTRNLAMDTNINRYDKPVKTSVGEDRIAHP